MTDDEKRIQELRTALKAALPTHVLAQLEEFELEVRTLGYSDGYDSGYNCGFDARASWDESTC